MSTRSGKVRSESPQATEALHDPAFLREVERLSGWTSQEINSLVTDFVVPDHWNGIPCVALVESIRNCITTSNRTYTDAFPIIFQALNLKLPKHLAALLSKLKRRINMVKETKNFLLLSEEIPGLSMNSVPEVGPLCEKNGINPNSLVSSVVSKPVVTNGIVIELNKYREKTNATWKTVAEVWWPNLFDTSKTPPIPTIRSSWCKIASKRQQLRQSILSDFLHSTYSIPKPKALCDNNIPKRKLLAKVSSSKKKQKGPFPGDRLIQKRIRHTFVDSEDGKFLECKGTVLRSATIEDIDELVESSDKKLVNKYAFYTIMYDPPFQNELLCYPLEKEWDEGLLDLM